MLPRKKDRRRREWKWEQVWLFYLRVIHLCALRDVCLDVFIVCWLSLSIPSAVFSRAQQNVSWSSRSLGPLADIHICLRDVINTWHAALDRELIFDTQHSVFLSMPFLFSHFIFLTKQKTQHSFAPFYRPLPITKRMILKCILLKCFEINVIACSKFKWVGVKWVWHPWRM